MTAKVNIGSAETIVRRTGRLRGGSVTDGIDI
jgi:hypothetical protein